MRNLLTLGLIIFTLLLQAQKNIQWRGENRTGIYNEKNLLKSWKSEGPELLWHFDGLDEGHSSVAISSDKIYVTGMTGKTGYLYVFDLNGKLLNKKEYGQEWDTNYNGPRGTVTVHKEKIYLISGTGNLICMDEKSLEIVWQKNIEKDFAAENIKWGINESPLIIDDKIIMTPGGKKYNVVALNRLTGDLIWSSSGEGNLSAYCSPLYISELEVPQIVTMTADYIIGIEAATGKKLWSHKQTNRWSVHANTPIYGNNMVLCTSGYGKGSVMFRFVNGGRSVEKVWELADIDSRIGGMVKLGDYLYGSGDFNKFWFCIDWKTGKIIWKNDSLPTGVTIAADDMLYCYSDKGDMALVKATPEKFEITGNFKITLGTEQHWAHPVIYQGVLYVRHGNTLMAYKIK